MCTAAAALASSAAAISRIWSATGRGGVYANGFGIAPAAPTTPAPAALIPSHIFAPIPKPPVPLGVLGRLPLLRALNRSPMPPPIPPNPNSPSPAPEPLLLDGLLGGVLLALGTPAVGSGLVGC